MSEESGELKCHTFTGANSLPDPKFKTSGSRSEILLGEDGDVWPSSVIIKKKNRKGTYSPLRTLTEEPTNRNILIETAPGSIIDITVSGALYVEINDLTERKP